MEAKNKPFTPAFIKALSIFVAMIFILGSCQLFDKNPEPTNIAVETIDPVLVEFLDSQKQVDLPLSKFILPNGRNAQEFYDNVYKKKGLRINDLMAISGPQEKKNILIDLMLKKGREMTDKTILFTDVTPKQKGIAYSLGAKDYTILQSPTQGSCNRNQKFHGIDCSGYIYQMASAAGLDLGNKLNLNAQALSNPDLWQNAIQARGDEYKKIRVENVSNEVAGQDSKLETGDIIYFYNENKTAITHIAMVSKDANSGIYFLNSYGNPDKNCESHFSKGPTLLSIDKKSWFNHGYNYGVLRIITDISGDWDMYIRCNGQTYDALKYNLSFTTSKDNENVTGQGNGVDYDGVTILDVKFTGQYLKQDNLLKGKLSFSSPNSTNGNRSDSFEIRLNNDDTGYFNAQKVISNGGCYVQLRLVNLEK